MENDELIAREIAEAIRKQLLEFLQMDRAWQYDIADMVPVLRPIISKSLREVRIKERNSFKRGFDALTESLNRASQEIEHGYLPEYGDDKVCVCGDRYYRHFDTYENMSPVGCKYCDCRRFKSPAEGHTYHFIIYDEEDGQLTARNCTYAESKQQIIDQKGIRPFNVQYASSNWCRFCNPNLDI